MSVIAWDGRSLAADRQGSYNEMPLAVMKIARAKNGSLLGLVGSENHFKVLREWFDTGCHIASWPAFQRTDDWSRFVVITHKSCVYYEQEPYPIPVQEKFFAWGCGKDLAMGAMAMGASATQAVEVASFFNVWCGKGIDVLTL